MTKAIRIAVLIAFIANSGFGFDAIGQPGYRSIATFLYNLLMPVFIEWPEEVYSKSTDTVTIGILGDDPFGDTLQFIDGITVFNRTLVIERFDKDASPEDLSRCQIVFIPASLEKDFPRILESIQHLPILTVSDIEGFIDRGGMIDFIVINEGLDFEINRSTVERANLKCHSRLLGSAHRIVEDHYDN